jgi:hypothetical protein
MLRDVVEIIGLAVGLAGLVQLYLQDKERKFLFFVAVLFLFLLAAWEVYSAVNAAARLSMTRVSIVNLLRNRPETIDEITQGLQAVSPNEVPVTKEALAGLMAGPNPPVWFNDKVYLEPSTGIEYHFKAYYLKQ